MSEKYRANIGVTWLPKHSDFHIYVDMFTISGIGREVGIAQSETSPTSLRE